MSTTCKFCGCSTVVKAGMRKGIQIYKCRRCKHRFFENGVSFARMRTPQHVIVAALNMYFDGLSVRKVSKQINDIFGEKSSQVTVWSWIQKYSRLVSDYANTLQPSLSGKYHHDETEIKVDGSGRYFWQTIDEDTRYIVAHLLTKGRSKQDAIDVFRQALRKQRPIALFTDGSFYYASAYKRVYSTDFQTSKVEWIRRVGIRTRETNNIVERLHQTLKDRTKVMRGLKDDKATQTLLDGYVAYYNFCRNHQAIGKTPAEAAGLSIKGWKALIEKAQIQVTEKEIQAPAMEVKVKH